MKKLLVLVLCATTLLASACSASTAGGEDWAKENGYIKAEDFDGAAWAEENGYIKAEDFDGAAWAAENGYVKASAYNINTVDALTSATQTGEGGLNFGTVEWSDELKKEAIREYLKGDASALYEDGYNHRNMFSLATSYNNKPIIGSVEFAMTDDFAFVAGSEANTEKLNAMQQNPYVSLYWTRQFRDSDGMPSYFYSYGVEIQGTVAFFDWTKPVDQLTDEIAKTRNYFKTMGPAYGKYYDPAAEGYMDDAALVARMAASPTVYYQVIPYKIVITSPYVLFMMNQGGNFAVINTATGEWVPYPFVSSELLSKMAATVAETYPGSPLMNGLQLSAVLKQMGMEVPADGLQTQTTLYLH